MRLFIALDLPADLVDRIDAIIGRLKPAARISWSPAANLHITTKFIGEWPEERLGELKRALAVIPSRPHIDVHIHGTGFFPNAKSPRTFWCGIDAPGLAELAADTDAATSTLGIECEKRPYSPHLTLARIKAPTDLTALHRSLATRDTDFGRYTAEACYLYRSQLRPTGSVYTKLAEFPLTHS